jgi:hypothetical protein
MQTKTQIVKGHKLKMKTFVDPCWCDACKKLLWGLVRQGYQCIGVSCTSCTEIFSWWRRVRIQHAQNVLRCDCPVPAQHHLASANALAAHRSPFVAGIVIISCLTRCVENGNMFGQTLDSQVSKPGTVSSVITQLVSAIEATGMTAPVGIFL